MIFTLQSTSHEREHSNTLDTFKLLPIFIVVFNSLERTFPTLSRAFSRLLKNAQKFKSTLLALLFQLFGYIDVGSRFSYGFSKLFNNDDPSTSLGFLRLLLTMWGPMFFVNGYFVNESHFQSKVETLKKSMGKYQFWST